MLNFSNFIEHTHATNSYAESRDQSLIYDYSLFFNTALITVNTLGVLLTAYGLSIRSPLFAFRGVFALGVSAAFSKVVGIMTSPFQHAMEEHAFEDEENACEGRKLFYQGDVPILTLDAETPFENGRIHGCLLAPQISEIRSAISFTLHTLMDIPYANHLVATMTAIRKQIPKEYLEELEGLVSGYNAKEGWLIQGNEAIVDELILFHLMADINYFSVKEYERAKNPQRININAQDSFVSLSPVACTVIMDNDEKMGPSMGRNMDWLSFGVLGKYSLIINRKNINGGHATIEIGVPGLVGTLTGLNSQGLALAMNVCTGNISSVDGMPASFYNCRCLESCSSVDEVTSFVEHHEPLGPYHLNVADEEKFKSFHFFQGASSEKRTCGSHFKRDETHTPLVTTNCNYSETGMTGDFAQSKLRHSVLNRFFQDVSQKVSPASFDKAQLLRAALSLPHVNTDQTVHTVFMQPRNRRMEVSFDNAFAGKHKLHPIDTEELLDQNNRESVCLS